MSVFKQFFDASTPAGAPFRIRGLGLHERMPATMVDRRTGTPDYLIMCFHDPVCVWERDALHLVKPPGIIIWEPGHRQNYGHPETTWDHSWIHCEGPFLARTLQALRLLRNRILPIPDPLILGKALTELHTELTLHRRPDPAILRDTFDIFLHNLARAQRKPDTLVPVPERFRAIRGWIDAHYDQSITLAALARQTHLSVPHFCCEFRRYFGMSAIDYLIRMRMQMAAHHLGDCNRNITDVALLVGYENLFHFSRLFKQRFGMSPKAMRARIMGLGACRT